MRRSGFHPTAALSALLLVACEPMPPSGAPFAPVADRAASAAGGAEDPRFDRPEPKVWTSEELHAAAKSDAPAAGGPVVVSSGAPLGGPATPAAVAASGAAPTSGPGGAASPPAPSPAPAPASVATATPSAASAAPSAPGSSTPAVSGAWPLRLVRALPDTIPPRAILGLPDGREVVVSPGTMLPEVGVVVMAVGRERLQVAKIAAVGDHAAVQEITLSSQY